MFEFVNEYLDECLLPSLRAVDVLLEIAWASEE